MKLRFASKLSCPEWNRLTLQPNPIMNEATTRHSYLWNETHRRITNHSVGRPHRRYPRLQNDQKRSRCRRKTGEKKLAPRGTLGEEKRDGNQALLCRYGCGKNKGNKRLHAPSAPNELPPRRTKSLRARIFPLYASGFYLLLKPRRPRFVES